MTNEKHFPKTISQWEFDYGLFTNLPRIIVAFIQTQRRYPTSLDTYPNLKTTCHIQLKFFLWTKIIENLLLAKYLISVAAPLRFLQYSQETPVLELFAGLQVCDFINKNTNIYVFLRILRNFKEHHFANVCFLFYEQEPK